jgi:DNA invertase Pin-like site-specific DNA recombinase
MACVVYTRQSDTTNDKRADPGDDTLSLEAQAHACRAHAARHGWEILETYSEQFSGFSDQRQQFQRMLRDIKANHKSHAPGDPRASPRS